MPDLDLELARQERIYLTEPRSLDDGDGPDDEPSDWELHQDDYHADGDQEYGCRER